MSNLTAEVARLVATRQPDEAAREQARQGVLDFFAVAFPVVNGTLPDATRETIRAILMIFTRTFADMLAR